MRNTPRPRLGSGEAWWWPASTWRLGVAAAVPAAVMPVPITVMVADDWLAWAIEPVRRSVGLNIAYRTASA